VCVALLVATVTFGANLRHLVTTPAARGWTWDLEVGNFSQPQQIPLARRTLARDPDVAAFTGYGSESMPVEGHTMDVLGIEDPPLSDLPELEGRLPSTRGEIAFTRHTLRLLGHDVGDEMTIDSVIGPPRRFRIVGVTLGPGAVDQNLDIQRGAIVRWDDLHGLLPESVVVNRFLVRFREGIDPAAALRGLRPQFGLATFRPALTSGVASVQRVQPLLVLFAAVVLVLAGGTLVHALHAATRRHRRDLAVLKALGHDRRQTAGTVVLQSVTIAARAMILGIPLGLIVGRWAWAIAASTIGVVDTVRYPLAVLLAILAVLVAAAATGVPSAGRARRVPVAEALRTE
jgi:putative ABC transport system permease protein